MSKKPVAENGYLREWLVLGSFAGRPRELMFKALIPETSILPEADKKIAGLQWKVLKAADKLVNLESLTPWWSHHSQCCGYAHLYLHSAKAEEAYLSLGSDDGAVIWFNGRRVFAIPDARGNTPDQDRVAVSLVKGWNRVLVKILQYDGGWSFCLRLLDQALRPMNALSYSLNDPLKGRWPAADKSKLPLSFLLQPPLPAECLAAQPGRPLSLGLLIQNLGEAPLRGVKLNLSAAGAPERQLPLPDLKPLESHALRFELSADLWARSYALPLRLKAGIKGKTLSLEQSLKTGLGSAFVAATAGPLNNFLPAERELIASLRQEVAAAPEVMEEIPELQSLISTLTLAILKPDLQAAKACLGLAGASLQRAKAGLAGQAVHLVGHAHIDMNWLWRWNETVQCCADTFSQALRFMKEFPEFRFTQSQASCYEAMQLEEPEIFAGIRQAIKDGQWNVVGGMWTEGDTNMSSGEAIARSCLLAQRYFQSQLGTRASVGWLPDNFGHVAQLPQIFHLAGMNAFYHSRTGPEPQLYWWEGLDGTRLLAKTGQGYNDAVSTSIRRQPQAMPKGVNEQMFVYGVGDHGGGPTRRDIEAARSMQGKSLFPEIRFSTADDYFERVRPKSAGLHVQKGELGYIFEGCYTNIATIKQGNRDLENALQAAEALAWAAHGEGLAWPKATLEEAWKILAFNQFHDILPGSAIHPSNDDTRGIYARGIQLANQVRAKSLRYLSNRVGIEAGDGIPVLVFNPLAWQRDELAVAELIFTERFHSLKMLDPQGCEIPVQVIRTRDFGADFHVWIQFYAKQVPGLGYQCYRVMPQYQGELLPLIEWGEQEREPMPLPKDTPAKNALLQRKGFKIRNPFFEVEFDSKDGSIKSFCPLKNGKPGPNLFGKAGGNKLGIYMEKPHPMSAWTLDPTAEGPLPVNSAKPLEVAQEGPESITLRAELTWGRSNFRLLTTIHAESPRIDCVLKVDWLEKGTGSIPGPMLRALWDMAKTPKVLTCDVPFGVLMRQPGREVPAQKWVVAGDLAVLNRGKYGHSLMKNSLRLSLLRSSYDPDPFPDLGHHEIQWGIQAQSGPQMPRQGMSYNVPLECYQARTQSGPLPIRHAFLNVDSDPAFVVTGLKIAEEGKGSILRGYDSKGLGCEVDLHPPGGLSFAAEVNILEEPVHPSGVLFPVMNDGRARLKVKPWGIASLRWVQKG